VVIDYLSKPKFALPSQFICEIGEAQFDLVTAFTGILTEVSMQLSREREGKIHARRISNSRSCQSNAQEAQVYSLALRGCICRSTRKELMAQCLSWERYRIED